MIRAARREDLGVIAALESEEPLGTQWTHSQLEQELENPRTVFLVATVEQRIVGHVFAWKTLDELEILTVAVRPEHRKQGLGRALLHTLLMTEGVTVVFLEVRASNSAARALYRSSGFQETGTRKRYYRDGEDAVLMRRSLL